MLTVFVRKKEEIDMHEKQNPACGYKISLGAGEVCKDKILKKLSALWIKEYPGTGTLYCPGPQGAGYGVFPTRDGIDSQIYENIMKKFMDMHPTCNCVSLLTRDELPRAPRVAQRLPENVAF